MFKKFMYREMGRQKGSSTKKSQDRNRSQKQCGEKENDIVLTFFKKCGNQNVFHFGKLCPKLKVTHALLQGDIPDPGTKPTCLTSPAFAGGFFTTNTTWEAHKNNPPSTLNHRLNARDIFTFENNIGV